MTYPIVKPVEPLHAAPAAFRARPKSQGNFVQDCNHVYAEALGAGLVMDIFRPLVEANGRAIVDVISGGWQSDRARLNEHIGLGLIDSLCGRGYTVFAVAPGSASLFTGLQMTAHVHAAIRHVRSHAHAWYVAAEPLGLAGASAGGHIAALAALSPQLADGKARDSWKRHGTAVQAVGLFFPPTDLADFGGRPFAEQERSGPAIPRLFFEDGLEGHDAEEIRARAEALSPCRQVGANPPPFILFHGDADPVVPLEQSEKLRQALLDAGGEAELVVKPGGRHPWPGARVETERMADWFDARLR